MQLRAEQRKSLPSRDCVGGQWVRRCCARSRMLGKLRQQPGLEQGICFPGSGRRLGGRRSSLVPETVLVRPKLGPGQGWPLSGTGNAPCWAPLSPPRSHTGGVIARSGPGSSPMEKEVAVAATTGDKTSLSVSLELGSAVAGMSGLGPKGSSSILGPARPLVPAAPAALAEAATTLWAAAGSRSRRRHFPPSRSRESGGRDLRTALREGAGAENPNPELQSRPRGGVASRGQSWGAR